MGLIEVDRDIVDTVGELDKTLIAAASLLERKRYVKLANFSRDSEKKHIYIQQKKHRIKVEHASGMAQGLNSLKQFKT